MGSDPLLGDSGRVVDAEIMDAQADLQTALGLLRCHLAPDMGPADLTVVEDRLARSLARLHRLLDDLGRPMYDPATHPEVH